MPTPFTDQNLAVFIDIENLVVGARTLGLPITVDPILRRLKEYGRILLRRSYGDLKKCLEASPDRGALFDQIRRMLHENLVQIEDIPFVTQHKNAADLQLVVEALTVAFTNDTITTFVVVSSDRDYVPLYNKLHELGKSVITIPIDRENVHRMIVEAADQVIYYESLFDRPAEVSEPNEPVRPSVPAEKSEPPATSESLLYLEYVRSLQQVLRSMAEQGVAALGSTLRPRLQQIRSDFDLSLIGELSLKGFIRRAEKDGFVRVDWADGEGDFTAKLGATSLLSSPTRPPVSAQGDAEREKSARAIIQFLDSKIRVPLPDFDHRQRILEAAANTFDSLISDGSFPINEWKEATLRRLAALDFREDERVVYKLLLSLRFARCLFWEPDPNSRDPLVTGRRVPPADWESWLVANWMKQVHFEQGIRNVDPAVWCRVFYPKRDDASELVGRAQQLVDSGG